MGDKLQDTAAQADPDGTVEDKARELIPELRRQAEESEAKESDEDFDSADAAPPRTSPGVAEHERDMGRRGFQQAGPPRD